MEKLASEWTEWLVHTLMFWETDDERKGKILRWVHHSGTNFLVALIVFSHLIYPKFWLQTLVLYFCILVWIQHILCNGCVISKVEQKLLGDSKSFIDPVLELFHLQPTKELSIAVLILGSTLGVSLLSLEWIARVQNGIIYREG